MMGNVNRVGAEFLEHRPPFIVDCDGLGRVAKGSQGIREGSDGGGLVLSASHVAGDEDGFVVWFHGFRYFPQIRVLT